MNVTKRIVDFDETNCWLELCVVWTVLEFVNHSLTSHLSSPLLFFWLHIISMTYEHFVCPSSM